MNRSIIKIALLTLSFFITGSITAQEKLVKISKSIKVNKDVTIDLNTSYCNIIFDTWNRNIVEIEAHIEGSDLSKDELEDALGIWGLNVDASKDFVSIEAKGSKPKNVWVYKYDYSDNDATQAVLDELKFELADFDYDFEMPELPEIPELPEMPEMPELPELPEGIHKFHFDYNAYKKEGEKYLDKYTQQFESKYGKDYEKKMEAWGEKFGKEWGEKYAEKMEKWGERFGEQMERQAERVVAQKERAMAMVQNERVNAHKERIEAHKERAKALKERAKIRGEKLEIQRENHVEKRQKLLAIKRKILINKMVGKQSKVKKTIKIKMPKGAKLKVNVRHGEIEFASNVNNLKADLSHTKFTAYSINGGSTSINASYSPIHVTYWNLGELHLNYVENAELSKVRQLVLTSNSSNITINTLLGNAIIDGNIGDLEILKIDDIFSNLNLILQNSNAVIALPKVAYNLQYKGNYSRFTHPKKTSKNTSSTFSIGNSNSTKSIVVNAKYSKVTMK